MSKTLLKLLIVSIVALCAVSQAETDYKAQEAIDAIRLGKDSPHGIVTLRVKTGVILPAGSIETADLADSSVTSVKIAAGTVVASDLATNAVTTEKIVDAGVRFDDLMATNSGLITAITGGASRGLKVQFGSCTGTAVKVFAAAFGATPAVFIGPEADVGTGRVFAASVTTNGFTASGFGETIAAGWVAIGLAP